MRRVNWLPGSVETMQSNERDSLDSRIDAVLNKYVAVWLWSILFGTSVGALHMFTSSGFGRFGKADLLIVPLILLGGVFSLMSLARLFRYLFSSLLPAFKVGGTNDILGPGSGSQLLFSATRWLLLSYITALFLGLAQHVLTGLGG